MRINLGDFNTQIALDRRAACKLPQATLTEAYIALDEVMYTIVSPEDYEWLSRHIWSVSPYGYATRHSRSTTRFMHREIMEMVTGCKLSRWELVDHENLNPLDNRRSNLRLANQSLNMANRGVSRVNTSGYKGVSLNKISGKWSAHIKADGTKIAIGGFSTAVEAAYIYDQIALQLHGDFARTNFVYT